ncbi:MAG: UbiA family prenyltransferase [Nostoc sp.]|uniref:UbiA family prenyltransferase n=1 Tax=Nostoc sp. TaxID=1180 RepID=UPI002FFA03E2
MRVVDPHGFNSALDVDVGWVERSATQLIIRMLGYAKLHPTYNFFASVVEKSLTAIATSSKKSAYCLAAMRPRQWTKNLVVFAAPLFAFSINLQSLLGSLLAFILFCSASSGFYLINDIADVESDRQHPVKCKRPIAAGLVSIRVATGMTLVLLD